jgi:hypothetical protein
MKSLLIAILISTAVQADSIERNPWKIYCGECFSYTADSVAVDGMWLPIEEASIPDHGIKPSTTVWPEAEIFIINHPEVGERSEMPSFSLDSLINALSFGGLVFASVWWLIAIVLRIKIL